MAFSSKERKQPSLDLQNVILIDDDEDYPSVSDCISKNPSAPSKKRARSDDDVHVKGVHRHSKKSKKESRKIKESKSKSETASISNFHSDTSSVVVIKNAHKHRSSTGTSRALNKSSNVDDYSNFINNKIAAVGKKEKTTKELLLDIQSRRSNFMQEEFKNEDTPCLNNNNISIEINLESNTKEKKTEESSVKFESIESILSRLPPIDKSWMYTNDNTTPICTCTILYNNPRSESLDIPKKSIFDIDYTDTSKDISIDVFDDTVTMFEEKVDPHCKAAEHFKINSSSDLQIFALHNFFIPDVNGTLCDESLQCESRTKPICRMDFWGSKPFYDCANRLFYNVVPKYKYLDYSLDRCVKNLSKVPFNKYKPDEGDVDNEQELSEIEKNTSNLTEMRALKTETLINNQSDTLLNQDNCNRNKLTLDIDNNFIEENLLESNVVRKKQRRQLTYCDSVIMSLPLNLRALNAAVGCILPALNQNVENVTDISTKFSYSVVAEPIILPLHCFKNDDLINDFLQKDKSSSDMDQNNEKLTKINNSKNTVHNSAFNSEFDKCVSDGCPEWLVKLSRPKNFREWHEPVVKLSYNNEPLTILPYVILD